MKRVIQPLDNISAVVAASIEVLTSSKRVGVEPCTKRPPRSPVPLEALQLWTPKMRYSVLAVKEAAEIVAISTQVVLLEVVSVTDWAWRTCASAINLYLYNLLINTTRNHIAGVFIVSQIIDISQQCKIGICSGNVVTIYRSPSGRVAVIDLQEYGSRCRSQCRLQLAFQLATIQCPYEVFVLVDVVRQ